MSTFTNGKGNNNNNKSRNDDDDTRRARDATIQLQQDTKASLERTRAAATETTELGATTLEELYKQRQTLEKTLVAGDRLNAELDKTEKMQNTLSLLGGWNHWGKRSEAKKIVKQDLKTEQQQQQAKEERKQQAIAAAPSSSLSSRSSPSVVVVEKKKKMVWKKEKPPIVSVSATEKKTLGNSTYGLKGKSNTNTNNSIVDKEHEEYLQNITETDQEIDAGLNAVDDQLDHLLDLAQTMKNEICIQSTVLNQVNDQIQDATQKQKVASHRMKRFF